MRRSSFVVMVASRAGFTVSHVTSLLVFRHQLAYRFPTFAAIPSGTARNWRYSDFLLSHVTLSNRVNRRCGCPQA